MKFTKLKKSLAVILSAAMVFSCLPATAMAEQIDESESVAELGGSEDDVAVDSEAKEEAAESAVAAAAELDEEAKDEQPGAIQVWTADGWSDAEFEESEETEAVEVNQAEEEVLAAEEEENADEAEEDVDKEETVSGDFVEAGFYDLTGYKVAGPEIDIKGITIGYTGTDNATGHGVHGKADDVVTLNLEKGAYVTFTTCCYSKDGGTVQITSDEVEPVVSELEEEGKPAYSYFFRVPEGGEFAAKVAASQVYLPSISVEYYDDSFGDPNLFTIYDYDLEDVNAATFASEDGVVEVNATGNNHSTGHGMHINVDSTIKIKVAGNSMISLLGCQWGADTDFEVTDSKDKKVGSFTWKKAAACGDPSAFEYSGDADTLTLKATKGGNAYLHGIVLSPGPVLTYDFSKAEDQSSFKSEDGVIELNATGGDQKSGHGAHFAKDDTIQVRVAGDASIGLQACVYGGKESKMSVKNGLGQEIGEFTWKGASAEKDLSKFKYEGDATTLTLSVEDGGNMYLHGIVVDYNGEVQVGDAYIEKTFEGEVVVDRETKGLKAHIFKADGTEIDAVAADDETMYMGNSSSFGKIGENKVDDNLIWTDGKKLVITPHTDEEGYSLIEPGESYYVTLDEGLVTVGGSDAGIKDKADWTFTATAAEGLADDQVIFVGSGEDADFRTLSGAFDYLRKNKAEGDWFINVDKGVYHERPFYYGDANITISGNGARGKFGQDVLFTWKNVEAYTSGGARGRSTFLVQGNGDMNLIGISMENTYDRTRDGNPSGTQAETLAFDGTGRLFVYDCGFYSHQDTLYIGKKGNRSWFYKSYIEGDVDFLWGYAGVCLFEECTLGCLYDDIKRQTSIDACTSHLIASRAEVADAANAGANKGFVLMNSTVLIDDDVVVNYARNSGSDTNAAIINNVFLPDGEKNNGKVSDELYGSAPGYEEKDANGDVVVGYFDGDNYTDAAMTNKVDTSKRKKGCDELVPRMVNREYSGRYVILNRGFDLTERKFVTAKKIWDAAKLAKDLGIEVSDDDSDKQIFVEPVAYKNIVGGESVSYNAFNVKGEDITSSVSWNVTEKDANDDKATGNTAGVDAKMNDAKAGQLDTKELTRSKVTVTAKLDGKEDEAYCDVIPVYVPADTVSLNVVKTSINLYAPKYISGKLSCSTNSEDEVSLTETHWLTSDSDTILFYDEANKVLVKELTTEDCGVIVYAKNSGSAFITASTDDGGFDICKVSVYDDQMEWTPFSAGLVVNTDVQSGKWGTFNGMQIDAITNNGQNGSTAKVGMKSGIERIQTRNVILSIPSEKDATLKMKVESLPDVMATAETVDTLNYRGIYADGEKVTWDADALTFTVDYKVDEDAQTAHLTSPTADTKAVQSAYDPGIDESELSEKKYLQLRFGSKDIYVMSYVLTQDGHKDEPEVKTLTEDVIETTADSVTVVEGEDESVDAYAMLANGEIKAVTWKSGDESIATINEGGKISGVKPGTTKVTASYGDLSVDIDVTVEKKLTAIESIELNVAEGIAIEEGDTEAVTATVKPDKAAEDAEVTWTSSDDSIATVKDGVITGVKAGIAEITVTAKTSNEKSKSIIVVVVPKISAVNLNTKDFELTEGDSKEIKATVEPKEAADLVDANKESAIFWKSSDDSIATVKDGKVTAVKAGEATITVTAVILEGKEKSASVKVTVKAKETKPTVSEDTVSQDIAKKEEKATEDRDKLTDQTKDKKGTIDVKGAYQSAEDTVSSDLAGAKGKVKTITINPEYVKDGENHFTINTKVKLNLGAGGYTVSANYDPKTNKKLAKSLKVNKKTGAQILNVKAIKGMPCYELTLVSGKKTLVIDVVDVTLDKKALKSVVLSTAVSANSISANAVRSEKISGASAENKGVVTIATTPQLKGLKGREKSSARFLMGTWMVGKTPVSSKETKVAIGKKGSVLAQVNSDGTLSIAKAEGSAKCNVAIVYTLNGKSYKAKVKVQ